MALGAHTLWFIAARTPSGENSMDLFVHAVGGVGAFMLWRHHYDGWSMPETVKVYDLGAISGKPSIVEWDRIPCYTFIV